MSERNLYYTVRGEGPDDVLLWHHPVRNNRGGFHWGMSCSSQLLAKGEDDVRAKLRQVCSAPDGARLSRFFLHMKREFRDGHLVTWFETFDKGIGSGPYTSARCLEEMMRPLPHYPPPETPFLPGDFEYTPQLLGELLTG